MPYCVNCGVELNADAKRCPLCGVEVILPADHVGRSAANHLPQQRHIVENAFDKALWIQVVSALMVIPALISLVINAVFGDGLTWSLYVVASLGAGWVWCVSPFLYRRNIVALWIALDEIALLGLLYVISVLPPTSDWFLPLAVPITLCLTVLTLLVVTLVRRSILRELHIVAATLVAGSILCIAVEGAVDHYLIGTFTPQWSLLVAATCTPLAVVSLMLQRRRAIVEGMRFWFHM